MSISPQRRSFQGYSRVLSGNSDCFRPEKLSDVERIVTKCRSIGKPITARGAGFSYGDASFTNSGAVVDFSRLNRIHSVNWDNGSLIVEPGITFREVFQLTAAKGWALAVSPGLSNITIGGAVSMDIHGKNHRREGGFSRCVEGLEIRLADGKLAYCSRDENSDVFKATIGGLGQTGLIERVKLTCKRLSSSTVINTVTPTNGFDQIIPTLEDNKLADWTVYWGDLLNARSLEAVKGAVIASKPSDETTLFAPREWEEMPPLPLSVAAPFYNGLSTRVFNWLYSAKLRNTKEPTTTSLRSHLFTWDRLRNWNMLYGRKGFCEYQFAVTATNQHVIKEALSFLLNKSVSPRLFAMKLMQGGEGFLSYGAENGVSVLIDAPASSATLKAFSALDSIITRQKGRIHLAKDTRLNHQAASQMYGSDIEAWRDVLRKIDPNGVFSSAMTSRLQLRDSKCPDRY